MWTAKPNGPFGFGFDFDCLLSFLPFRSSLPSTCKYFLLLACLSFILLFQICLPSLIR